MLETRTDAFNLSERLSDRNNIVNIKWGNTIRGTESGEITWSMNLAGLQRASGFSVADFERVAFEAFAAWEAIAGLTFRFEEDFGTADIDINMANLSGSTLGVATTFAFTTDFNFSGLTEITRSDIEMDSSEFWRADGNGGTYTFVQVLMHEIGHALGLDHFDVSDSIMNTFANDGSRTLGDDDIAGVQNLYGARRWDNTGEDVDFKHIGVGQTVFAKGGNDDLSGTSRGDSFYGGFGDDDLYGQGGNDLLVDTRGRNDLFGGDGNDTIVGGGGTLNAEGNAGNDTLIGGIGDDVLDGGTGNDTLRGDPVGGFISGNDTLIAGAGNDVLEGGGGSDTFVFNRASGSNRILDFEVGFDMVELEGFTVDQGSLSASGDDTIFTFNQGSVRFSITFEDAVVTEADFM
ncbi:matrixin family metalloprotease [Yoonia sp. 2307UL14-13]|uniref:matrixin family metalloprotease n=1 Tax=Yoonia sp. 2307UL14-13 TaxID=3126506 RepID=UPI0030A24ECE